MDYPLEENFNDILQKAAHGHALSVPTLAQRSGVDELQLKKLFEGVLSEPLLRRVAPQLGLRADALCQIAKAEWLPQPHTILGLWQIRSPYAGTEVNAYLLKIPQSSSALLFDTGTDASLIKKRLKEESLELSAIFLTHTHTDHVAALNDLKTYTHAPAIYVSDKEPLPDSIPLIHGQTLHFGSLQLEARLTSGHSIGGMTYVIRGRELPQIAIVGDALFAGSMGRGFISYEEALRSNKAEILSLPHATILCPGHGPMTSVAEELEHNPFF
jgi:glyoxylase-like metal-dependent hydrolase (beta-lactamase superfamily II)